MKSIKEIGKLVKSVVINFSQRFCHDEDLQAENERLRQKIEQMESCFNTKKVIKLETHLAATIIRAERAEGELAVLKTERTPLPNHILGEVIEEIKARLAYYKDPKGHPVHTFGKSFYEDMLALLNDYVFLQEKTGIAEAGQ